MPDLDKATYSLSVCTFNADCLLAVGGINQEHKTIKTIRRLNLSLQREWEILSIKIPIPLSLVGIMQISNDKLVIFGGWNMEKVKNTFIVFEKE